MMASSPLPAYERTQSGPWAWLMYAGAAVVLSLTWMARNDPAATFILPFAGWTMVLLGVSFQYLTVVDEGDRLAVRFGPLPLFCKRVRYLDMREIEIGRLTLLDGWGIHLSLRGGWVWSIWGFDCVVVRYGRRTLRIGTDDAENLAQFLRSRLPGE